MAINVKKGKSHRKKEQFWPMKSGGPYSEKEGDAQEIFKCTGCGAETVPENGWNGEPNKHKCHKGCSCQVSDWKPGHVTNAYRERYEQTFGHP